jgi:hypothetical protein
MIMIIGPYDGWKVSYHPTILTRGSYIESNNKKRKGGFHALRQANWTGQKTEEK